MRNDRPVRSESPDAGHLLFNADRWNSVMGPHDGGSRPSLPYTPS